MEIFQNHLSLQQKAALSALILDMDGVVWRASQPVGDLPSIFNKIKMSGCRVIMATNNATRTPEQYLEKMHSFGVELEPWQVINSAQAAAYHLKKQFPGGGHVYIIGEEGLARELKAQGFTHATEGALAVVVGLDRGFTYEKLRTANDLIRNGAAFIATNPDPTFPNPDGLVPGAGAIIAAVQTAVERKPQIIGKPSPDLYNLALERLGTHPKETLAVGDRLETDIAGGQATGCPTALVLTGVSSLEMGRAWKPSVDVIARSLGDLVEFLTQ